MAKITMADGSTFEGTISEYSEFMREVTAFANAQEETPAAEAPTQVTRPITSYDELAVGMTLRCVKSQMDVTAGKTYQIVGTDCDEDYLVNDDGGDALHVTTCGGIGSFTKLFEIVGEAPVEPQDAPLKVGDYAKVTRKVNEFREGDIVHITEKCRKESLFDFRVDRIGKNDSGFVSTASIVKATDAEVAAAKAPKFSVGDKMRLKSTKGALAGFKTGQIVEVRSLYSGGTYPIIVFGDSAGFTDADNLERVTDAEVAATQASVAEAERWDEIGRKVNEFRKGDVVEARRSMEGESRVIGTLEDFRRVEPGLLAGISQPNNRYYAVYSDSLKLVTPVEDRFDR